MLPRTRQSQIKIENFYKQAAEEPKLDNVLSQALSRNKKSLVSKKDKLACKKKTKLVQQQEKDILDDNQPENVSTEAVGSSKSDDDLNHSTFVPEPLGPCNEF